MKKFTIHNPDPVLFRKVVLKTKTGSIPIRIGESLVKTNIRKNAIDFYYDPTEINRNKLVMEAVKMTIDEDDENGAVPLRKSAAQKRGWKISEKVEECMNRGLDLYDALYLAANYALEETPDDHVASRILEEIPMDHVSVEFTCHKCSDDRDPTALDELGECDMETRREIRMVIGKLMENDDIPDLPDFPENQQDKKIYDRIHRINRRLMKQNHELTQKIDDMLANPQANPQTQSMPHTEVGNRPGNVGNAKTRNMTGTGTGEVDQWFRKHETRIPRKPATQPTQRFNIGRTGTTQTPTRNPSQTTTGNMGVDNPHGNNPSKPQGLFSQSKIKANNLSQTQAPMRGQYGQLPNKPDTAPTQRYNVGKTMAKKAMTGKRVGSSGMTKAARRIHLPGRLGWISGALNAAALAGSAYALFGGSKEDDNE